VRSDGSSYASTIGGDASLGDEMMSGAKNFVSSSSTPLPNDINDMELDSISNNKNFVDSSSIPLKVEGLEGGLSSEGIGNENDLSYKSSDTSSLTDFTSLGSTTGLELFSESGYRDGCVELRGRLGSWEQDFSYQALAGEKAGFLRGSSLNGLNSFRYAPAEGMESNLQQVQGSDGGTDTSSLSTGWQDSTPDCGLDMLNIAGLCEVMYSMKLSVIQFVGDEYTEEMVKSFWALLDLPDKDDIGLQPNPEGDNSGELPNTYRKTVHCADHGFPISFDVVFTPNEKLVTYVQADPIEVPIYKTVYVPVPAPVTDTTNLVQGTQTVTGTQTTVPYGGNYWYNNPYAYPGGYGGFGGNCNCTPFIPQYQACAPMGRQIVIAGLSPNMSYDAFCQQFNAFGGGIAGAVNPADIVMVRSAVQQHGACFASTTIPAENTTTATTVTSSSEPNNARRTKEIMSDEEISKANDFMAKSIDEYRRRTRQMDLLSHDPNKSMMPRIHMLDVSYMTHSHPHARASSPENNHGRKLCEQQGMQTAPMYDYWNHVMYSNMKDMAAAELMQQQQQQQQQFVQSAPQSNQPGPQFQQPIIQP
jgi:hypothetical protein